MIARRLNAALMQSLLLRAAAVAMVSAALLITLAPPPAIAALIAMASVGATVVLILPSFRRIIGDLLHRSEALVKGHIDVLGVLGGTVARREHGRATDNSRLVLYAIRIAERAGLSAEQIRVLIKGAFVHDIGTVILPEEVLLKPGPLDTTEYEAVKTHVFHGVEVLSRSRWLKDASPVVRSHHEKWDGSGYPDSLKGEEIPVGARVFALADVFDALTSERPYRGRLSFDKAMAIMLMGRGGHFDPELFDAFAAVAAGMYDEVQARSDEDIEHELLIMAFRYFQSPGQGR